MCMGVINSNSKTGGWERGDRNRKWCNVNFFPKLGRLFGLSRLSLSLSSVRVIKNKKKIENILQIISTSISLFY